MEEFFSLLEKNNEIIFFEFIFDKVSKKSKIKDISNEDHFNS